MWSGLLWGAPGPCRTERQEMKFYPCDRGHVLFVVNVRGIRVLVS